MKRIEHLKEQKAKILNELDRYYFLELDKVISKITTIKKEYPELYADIREQLLSVLKK